MERALGYVMFTCLIRWMYNVCFLLLHWGNSFSYIKYGHSLPHCWEYMYTEINYKELTINESVRQTWVSLCYCQICYDLVHGNACLSFICNKKLPVLGQRSLLGVNLKGHQNGWLNFCKRKHWILHREQCVWVKYVQFFVKNLSKWAPVPGQRSPPGVNLKGHQNGWLNFCKIKQKKKNIEYCIGNSVFESNMSNFLSEISQSE